MSFLSKWFKKTDVFASGDWWIERTHGTNCNIWMLRKAGYGWRSEFDGYNPEMPALGRVSMVRYIPANWVIM